jgi:tRNA U34 5-carboxymethylaminomethyl modifying GTPase MnmE/TrmE
MSTVAAISTPLSEGGIAVIRISGDKAFSVAEKVFRPVSSDKKISEMKGYTCAFGKIFMGDEENVLSLNTKDLVKPRTGEGARRISSRQGSPGSP